MNIDLQAFPCPAVPPPPSVAQNRTRTPARRSGGPFARPWLGLAALLLWASGAVAGDLVIAVDTGTEMPFARIEHGQLLDGMHKDVGDELARRLGRTPVYRVLPRKRISAALVNGEADVLCLYESAWVPGPFDWTRPFFPHQDVIVTDARWPRPQRLAELAGQPIATVFGYQHPALVAELGAGFVREDGPSAETNLRKMAAGRVRHAIISAAYLAYVGQQGKLPLAVHEPMPLSGGKAQCAVSRRGQVPLAEVDHAVALMVRDHVVEQIRQRYRK